MINLISNIEVFTSAKTSKKFLILKTYSIDEDNDKTEICSYFLQEKDIILLKQYLKDLNINYKEYLSK